jgi:hypothetical protein
VTTNPGKVPTNVIRLANEEEETAHWRDDHAK